MRLYYNDQKTALMSFEINTVIPNFKMNPLKLVIDFKESHGAYSEKDFEVQKATALSSSNRLEKTQRSNLLRLLKKNFCT